MTTSEFKSMVVGSFLFPLTVDQENCIDDITKYFSCRDDRRIHIVNGYAGTGKTTLISNIVQCLNSLNVNTVLLAPTGRAAKVLSEHCKAPAYTIHKYIYRTFQDEFGNFNVILSKKQRANTIFFIDESSMIANGIGSGENQYSERDLLEDLLTFIFGKRGCKAIFIGDTAQLPPVGFTDSPALVKDTFEYYGIEATMSILTQVVRQVNNSPILSNATFIRSKLSNSDFTQPFFNEIVSGEFSSLDTYEFEDVLNTCFNNRGSDNESLIICRSNKQANLYNKAVRERIMYYESKIVAGEKLVVIKNNYFWSDKDSEESFFIANGEMIEIERVRKIEEIYGFTFAEVTISLPDLPYVPSLEVILMLDTLEIETASLPYEKKRELYNNILEEHIGEFKNKIERNVFIRSNPYYNALHVKYGYAMTCHKAQGGQWSNIFIDKGFIKEENIDEDYFRWLYTAVTRATQKVFLINF